MSRHVLLTSRFVWTLLALATAADRAAAQDAGIGPARKSGGERFELKLDPKLPGPERFPMPDLVAKFEWREGLEPASRGFVRLPVVFAVGNRGSAKAGRFKISIHYQAYDPGKPLAAVDELPTYVANFDDDRAPKEKGWYAWCPSLEPGKKRKFTGTVALPKRHRGKALLMYALADSTVGDESQPPHGRVRESNEGNNRSPRVRFNFSGGPASGSLRPNTVLPKIKASASIQSTRKKP
jgi:hypothetical protein